MSGTDGIGRDFRDFMSVDDFNVMFDHYVTRPENNSKEFPEWQREYQVQLRDRFGPALIGFLSALKEDGALKPIPGCEGRSGHLMDAWNDMATDSEAFRKRPERLWGAIAHRFSRRFFFDAVYPACKEIGKGGDPGAIRKDAYANLASAVNKGDVEWFEMGGEEYCSVSGDRLSIDLQGWHLRLGMIGDDGEFEEVKGLTRAPVKSLEVEFKTGDLLIADWFRIDEFTKSLRESDRFDINSTEGREKTTEWYLREKGVVSVSVGNTSPKVLGTDGSLIVGWVDEDSEDTDLDGVEFVGSVCTDLWWTTIVERGRLVDIVAETLGREEAERKVAAYLEENESNFDAVKVEPGTYHLYFSGSERDFKDGFKPANLKVGKGIEPFFVLANRPLTLDATADASPPEPLP